MKITITLSEALDRCNNWTKFCEHTGFAEWAVKEGCGDIEVNLTYEEAVKFGIIRGE